MDVYIARMLAIKPDASPYELFAIPKAVLGERNMLPNEYLEAVYCDHVSRIVAACQQFPREAQPRVAASQVHDYLATPGAWFPVAHECRRWHRVLIPDHMIFADFFIVHYGMIVDVLGALDGEYEQERAAEAGRYIDAARGMDGSEVIAFFNEPGR